MATVTISTDPSALFWSQTTTLDGTPYLLTFRFNTRENAYYLTIAAGDGSVVYAQGVKLVPNYPLLLSYGLNPPGELMCISFSANDAPPGIGELGDGLRCALLYIEEADVIAGGSEGWRNPFTGLPV